MSLKVIHVFFILVSTLMCIGIAAFRLDAWRHLGDASALVQGLIATIGAAIRRMTSAPAPVAHRMGTSETSTVATVISLGRIRCTAPCSIAVARSA